MSFTPLATAAPPSVATASAQGTSTEAARRDHAHAGRPSEILFSGRHLGTAGATTNFLANGGADAAALVLTVAQGFPLGGAGKLLQNLSVRCPVNALGAAMTATVYINGAATAITVSVTAGATTLFKDTTHTVTTSADDRLDLRLDSTAAGAVSATVIATLEMV